MTLDTLINFKELEFPHRAKEWIKWYKLETLKSVSHHAVQSAAQHGVKVGGDGGKPGDLDPFAQACGIRGRADIRWDSDTATESCLETGPALTRGTPSLPTRALRGAGLLPGPDLFPFALFAHMLSCVRLCDPLNCSLPGSSVHGIFRARTLECVVISSPKASSWARDQIQIPVPPALAGGFFTTVPPRKPSPLPYPPPPPTWPPEVRLTPESTENIFH